MLHFVPIVCEQQNSFLPNAPNIQFNVRIRSNYDMHYFFVYSVIHILNSNSSLSLYGDM